MYMYIYITWNKGTNINIYLLNEKQKYLATITFLDSVSLQWADLLFCTILIILENALCCEEW